MIPLETRIDTVSVFIDRARITRRGKVTVSAGRIELVIRNLPISLLPESIRASARATAPTRLLGTEVNRSIHSQPVETKPAEIQKEIEALQDRDSALAARATALTARRGFLDTFAAASGQELARGVAFGRSDLETGSRVGEFLSNQYTVLDGELLEVARERRVLAAELKAAQERLAQLQRQRPTECYEAVILLEVGAGSEAEVEVELIYQVNGASWEPVYDLRLTGLDRSPQLEVAYQAQVTQHTGEAWNDVALVLSTARPALAAVLPELKPWFLRERQLVMQEALPMMKRARMATAPPAAAPAAAMADMATFAAPQMVEAEEEVAVVEDTGATVTFSVGGRTGVPDDGSPRKVTLGNHGFPARLDYISAPKLVTQAYLRARALNTSGAMLLPGAAQIFHDGEFVGATQLKGIAPGEECELFLGVDDRIKVERKLVEGNVDKKLLQDVRRLTYAYEIKVQNLKPTPETITILDQLPVSRHEFVKTRLTEAKPPPREATEMGRLTWELPLAAGEERTLRFGFVIEMPRDLQLEGLPPLRE